jgi:putative acetyltransferase
MKLVLGDFADERVLDLLRYHLAGMHANSPAGHVHALDLSGLDRPDVSFWTVWDGDDLMGCGAIKFLSADQAELKSMRTYEHHLRKGVGKALLIHLIDLARAKGMKRVSLETGSGDAFEPALALYRTYGFTNSAAFSDYVASDFNQFLHLDI